MPRTRSSVGRVSVPRTWPWILSAVVAAVAAVVLILSDFKIHVWRLGTNDDETVRTAHVVLALVSALVAAWAVRRARLAWLAVKPGPIQTELFVDATDKQINIDEVMWHFRRALSAMRLSPPASVPGGSTQTSWLEVMRTTVGESKSVVAAIAGLVSALAADHAYRVTGVLRIRSERPSFGVTVQVSLVPTGSGAVETVWDESWSGAAERAAAVVGAFVLPRTRLCRQPPWTAWQGLRMPYEVYYNHQRAKELVGERRYEEAMARYYDALAGDPQNPYLRIELLQIHEQLGLHLDAVAGYADIVGIEAWEDRRLWVRLTKLLRAERHESPRLRFRAPRDGPQALLLARYRLVCQLANGDQLAHQWLAQDPPGSGPRRPRERAAIRARACYWLDHYYGQFKEAYRNDAALPETLGTAAGRPALRQFFQYVAVREASILLTDYRWRALRRRRRMPVSQRSLRIMTTWAPLQLYDAERRCVGEIRPPAKIKEMTALRKRIEPDNRLWPPEADVVHKPLNRAMRSWLHRPDWQAEYNAACTLAVCLSPGTDPADPECEQRRRAIAEDAVRHLERAVASADSGYTALYSDWLAAGDQDLNDLRTMQVFLQFLARYFPGSEPRPYSPTRLIGLLASNHAVAIAQRYAALRARWWRSRSYSDADRPELGREAEVRRLMRAYAANVSHWQSRLDLIEESKRLAALLSRPHSPATFPLHADEPALRGEELCVPGLAQSVIDDHCDEVRHRRDAVWQTVIGLIDAAGPPGPVDSGRSWWHPRRDRSLELWQSIDEKLRTAMSP